MSFGPGRDQRSMHTREVFRTAGFSPATGAVPLGLHPVAEPVLPAPIASHLRTFDAMGISTARKARHSPDSMLERLLPIDRQAMTQY